MLSATRTLSGIGGDATYLPFAWERLWLKGPLTERIVCYARLRDPAQESGDGYAAAEITETLTGDLSLYSPEGIVLGGLEGFVLKRATRASLLSSSEGLDELLYEVVWRERPLVGRRQVADALTNPSAVAANTSTFAEYISREGVEIGERAALLADIERLSRSYALAALHRLGWRREGGAVIDVEALREELQVIQEHSQLLERMLRLLSDAEVLAKTGEGSYVVIVDAVENLPDGALADPEDFADRLAEIHPHGLSELGLLRRSGSALADVLRGRSGPAIDPFCQRGTRRHRLLFHCSCIKGI